MENDKLFDLMSKMYGELQQGFVEIRGDIQELKDGQQKTDNTITKIEVAIEQDIKPKIDMLFDGYKQNAEQLNRISEEVSKHEEVIIRRVK